MKNQISWGQFSAVNMRVGTIVSAESHPTAKKPAYILLVDFGEEIGQLKSSAQITEHYAHEGLVGKQVIGIVNFPPKQIGSFMSECLIMGIYDSNEKIVLLKPDMPVKNGTKIG